MRLVFRLLSINNLTKSKIVNISRCLRPSFLRELILRHLLSFEDLDSPGNRVCKTNYLGVVAVWTNLNLSHLLAHMLLQLYITPVLSSQWAENAEFGLVAFTEGHKVVVHLTRANLKSSSTSVVWWTLYCYSAWTRIYIFAGGIVYLLHQNWVLCFSFISIRLLNMVPVMFEEIGLCWWLRHWPFIAFLL